MTDTALSVLKYLKSNNITCPFSTDEIESEFSKEDIVNAVIELSELGCLTIDLAIDNSYAIVTDISYEE